MRAWVVARGPAGSTRFLLAHNQRDRSTFDLYEADAATRTVREVEPHYLLLSWPAWYLLVWDHLRGAVRALRVDRIEAARVSTRTFRVRSVDTMRGALPELFGAL